MTFRAFIAWKGLYPEKRPNTGCGIAYAAGIVRHCVPTDCKVAAAVAARCGQHQCVPMRYPSLELTWPPTSKEYCGDVIFTPMLLPLWYMRELPIALLLVQSGR